MIHLRPSFIARSLAACLPADESIVQPANEQPIDALASGPIESIGRRL